MPNAPFSTAPPQDVGRGKPHAERGCAGVGAEFALRVPERLQEPCRGDRGLDSLLQIRHATGSTGLIRHHGFTTLPALSAFCPSARRRPDLGGLVMTLP